MNEEMIKKLQVIASRQCWLDNDGFMVDDYAGGNIDDAYYGGSADGAALLARELLFQFMDTTS